MGGPRELPLPLGSPRQISVLEPVELWWPSGYGPQRLYNISATFQPASCSTCPCLATHGGGPTSAVMGSSACGGGRGSSSGVSCSSVNRTIGFRTLKLVTDPLTKVWEVWMCDHNVNVCVENLCGCEFILFVISLSSNRRCSQVITKKHLFAFNTAITLCA